MKRLVLDMDEVSDQFLDDARLLGVVTDWKPYQLCWALNHHYGYQFRTEPGAEIVKYHKQRSYHFTLHRHRHTQQRYEHFIYLNKDDGLFLMPEFNHIDFLWMIKGDWATYDLQQTVQQQLTSLPAVRMVTELSKAKIKNRDHLLV